MNKKYIRKMVEQATNIPARRIQFYTDAGLIKLGEQHTGRGKERHYSKIDMLRLLIIKELDKIGITLATIKSIFRFIDSKVKPEQLNPERFTNDNNMSSWLIIYDKDVVFQDNYQSETYKLVNENMKKDDKNIDYGIDLEMNEHASASVVNVRLLAEKLNIKFKDI